MDATRRLVEAMGSVSIAREADTTRGGEDSSGAGRETFNARTPPPPYSQTDSSSTLPPVERYVRADGRIGVLVSDGHHGGWSSGTRLLFDPRDPTTPEKTRRMQEIALFDKEVITAVLTGHTPQAMTIAKAKMGMLNQFPVDNVGLKVVWLGPGDEFEVLDHLGSERIRMKDLIEFWRA